MWTTVLLILLGIIFILFSKTIRIRSRSKPQSKQEQLGFLELSAGVNPIVDIIAIHGINGHRENSWTADNGTMWLRDILGADVPNARILTYGYDADTTGFDVTSTSTIGRHAGTFIEALARQRLNAKQRPIIFLAHSLGGIILKKALNICQGKNVGSYNHLRDILVSTHAILFFGTPHSGVKGVAFQVMLNRILSVYMRSNNKILKHLEEHSSELEDIQSAYLSTSEGIKNVYFYEDYATPIIGGQTKLIVPYHSATVAGERGSSVHSLSADHIQMIKYRGKTNVNYETVLHYLKEVFGDANITVEGKWLRERSLRSLSDVDHDTVLI
ncbi:hypothetical protein PIIN_05431 [Serendipita indica DSM 11827]|uniref:DUF676 domain-containing protein n=1 Tax=Serendipita indica (strain DSM 11827) TaxID=1109443 RepID=G4TJL3_SERID|nr:hypothetical protein PIIN_05431 [Serendipita indica DSM 11827]